MPESREATTAEGCQAQWEHAKTVWAAEEENARRLATRKALIVGIPLAFAALAGNAGGPARRVMHGLIAREVSAWICLLLAVIAAWHVVHILVWALPIRQSAPLQRGCISEGLNPIPTGADRDQVRRSVAEFLELDPRQAMVHSTTRVLETAHELNRANEQQHVRLQRALECVSNALLTCAIAVVPYLLIDRSYDSPEAPSHEREQPESDAGR